MTTPAAASTREYSATSLYADPTTVRHHVVHLPRARDAGWQWLKMDIPGAERPLLVIGRLSALGDEQQRSGGRSDEGVEVAAEGDPVVRLNPVNDVPANPESVLRGQREPVSGSGSGCRRVR
jgi:hypothetical protein